MRLNALLAVGLAVTSVAASSWFPGSKTDRKDLEELVSKNWNDYVVEPYNNWDTAQLSQYLVLKGRDAQEEAEQTRHNLIVQVKENWYESTDKAQGAFANTRDWILDTWTDSQLKAFCDKHDIPVPQPRQRDTLLQKARSAYEAAAKKAGDSVAYPGDWLYSTWSESDLKEWLDSHGFPAPQPTNRDRLIAAVRRNSRLAYLRANDQAASATASARAAYVTLTDIIIDAWDESQLKDFCVRNGISVPRGSKPNDIRSLVRKHRSDTFGESLGAATSKILNQYSKVTETASHTVQDAFDHAVDKWSESRLKAYLDARGVPVPQGSKIDELRALVRKNSHKAASGWQAWNFDDFSLDNLKNYISKNGNAAAKTAAKKKDAKREDLVRAAQSAFTSASSAGGSQYASATSYLASVTAAAKHNAFETWTESELKAYLDSYGVPVPQGSKIEELKALARKQSTYFKYGTSTPGETVLAKIGETAKDSWNWITGQLHMGSEAAKQRAAEKEAEAKAKIAQSKSRKDL
ncbi:Meiotic sister chromatid recombination protein 1 [Escovopsis weberi]|uniref:Meiotic sister chromatid recombination protein 1 n=1 Tax=Escovopsis weberi TaxID=150374 RepID=A0A0M9VWX5_ESCWE|nr:Meiotic sister chromatid recombination protein 1 [Escovopsis weberi]